MGGRMVEGSQKMTYLAPGRWYQLEIHPSRHVEGLPTRSIPVSTEESGQEPVIKVELALENPGSNHNCLVAERSRDEDFKTTENDTRCSLTSTETTASRDTFHHMIPASRFSTGPSVGYGSVLVSIVIRYFTELSARCFCLRQAPRWWHHGPSSLRAVVGVKKPRIPCSALVQSSAHLHPHLYAIYS